MHGHHGLISSWCFYSHPFTRRSYSLSTEISSLQMPLRIAKRMSSRTSRITSRTNIDKYTWCITFCDQLSNVYRSMCLATEILIYQHNGDNVEWLTDLLAIIVVFGLQCPYHETQCSYCTLVVYKNKNRLIRNKWADLNYNLKHWNNSDCSGFSK